MRPRLLKRTLAVLAGAALTTTFAACVSTEDESAKIERESRAALVVEARERAAKEHPRRGAHDHARAHVVGGAKRGGANG